ncbi:MAG: glycosyltransferase, partial [Pseudomonadota bacterium]
MNSQPKLKDRETCLQIDVSVVTYKPDLPQFRASLQTIAEQDYPAEKLRLLVFDNSVDDSTFGAVREIAEEFSQCFSDIVCKQGATNCGFGIGNNSAVALGTSPFIVILNQDIKLEPDSLWAAQAFASSDDEGGI